MLLDRDIADCSALVVDANPTSRSILAAQLRDFGVGTVQQTSRVADARRALELRSFDIVLCEQHFAQEGQTGQALLDDLRRAQLLPYSTVFIMITGEARYDKVAEAAEAALDSYLLKPYTATVLGERLKQARHRKKELARIFDAIEADDLALAARLCQERFASRAPYGLYAARIGVELLLRQGQTDAARALCQAVVDAQGSPWAKLGIARSQLDEGQPTAALGTLEALRKAHPGYTDAFDVIGRVQVEQGKLGDALETFRLASAATPHSIARLQKQGMLACYLGEGAEANKALDRAALLGAGSKMFDLQSLVLLALLRFRERDTRGLQRCADHLLRAQEREPGQARLDRFVRVVQVLQDLLARRAASAVDGVSALLDASRQDDFDVEAACNLLALLAELAAADPSMEGMDGLKAEAEVEVEALALRFASSRAVTELLARAAARHPPFEQRVREAPVRLTQLAEQALSHALVGQARRAVQDLVEQAESTGSAKLLDTARLTLQRYRDKIEDAAALGERVESLRRRRAGTTALPPLGQGPGRVEGGLALRTRAAGPPVDPLRDAA